MAAWIDGYVESQGVNIHYVTNGVEEAKAGSLLFVPGVMMPAWIWEKQLSHFSKTYRVVAMDPRSQGESGSSTEGHYAFSRSKDIAAVADHLKLKHLVLIGWSLGVPEAINYAAHFRPKDMLGLVLIDGLAGIDSTVPFYNSTVEYWSEFQVDRVAKTKEFIRLIFNQPHSEAYLNKLYETALRMPTNTVMALMNNYILQDFRPLLPKLNIPTLIATIEGPRLEYMQEMQALLPHARLAVIKSAGHALFVDQPETFNALLDAFILDLLTPKPFNSAASFTSH
ncbi:hypothetical protein PNK_0478 [Candidatus Protochlamydia naegleriophila]|uniref:AB hydrolase-1 domain-containing protein n=1 Tax=Candidatus Protochlamydia naegleriophila TaxID=389348 RepID=A0A0U5JBB6_9BACT|nr:alpha/beta hydrolase [Candidatus Protochlamydia naegleriophila]CUI16106.1 hypothetical protein PNK_0478 [Candidatus Protochlamydia naegleriophila]